MRWVVQLSQGQGEGSIGGRGMQLGDPAESESRNKVLGEHVGGRVDPPESESRVQGMFLRMMGWLCAQPVGDCVSGLGCSGSWSACTGGDRSCVGRPECCFLDDAVGDVVGAPRWGAEPAALTSQSCEAVCGVVERMPVVTFHPLETEVNVGTLGCDLVEDHNGGARQEVPVSGHGSFFDGLNGVFAVQERV